MPVARLLALMLLPSLFPKWDAGTGATGVVVNGQLQHARLSEAKPWEVSGHRGLAVLVETWLGDACPAAVECPPAAVALGLLELVGARVTLVASGQATTRPREGMKLSLDPLPYRTDVSAPLIGVREQSASAAGTQTVLRLFRPEGPVLQRVFERRVRDVRASPPRTCEATVSVDSLDQPPYALKVDERCLPLGARRDRVLAVAGDGLQAPRPRLRRRG
jgi:hypothetical protein